LVVYKIFIGYHLYQWTYMNGISVAKLCTVLLSFYSKLSKIIISVKKRNSRSLLAQNDIYKLVQAHWHTYMHYSRKLLMFGCAVGAPNVSLNVLKASLLKKQVFGSLFPKLLLTPKIDSTRSWYLKLLRPWWEIL
jgi:hypothetical protein